ncbi:uroporphyrinogen-III C-methyltransferase [Dehalococcoidales bacterium]|nr:uroporphyrinogen-III C-methyltransferase [Dehalococcoidales bacterium]MCL0053256.1 uroporphyrinogen-III C-methyltransferase [Dehalococcoidales bacterium]
MVKQGKVYLVGAGPGDYGLITVKGLDCLRQAEVIIYDRLVDESLLGEVHPDAEKIYVGKAAKCHIRKQGEINQLLVKKAKEGKVVVRLKGGDPFVLGRGGEEAEALALNHIPFEVVPGVSSALAVPAYAGIPVTHRRLASSLAIITGHEAGKGKSSIAWDKLATGADTLVFLMGVGNLAFIVERLIENGRAPSTPIALIGEGTTPKQQTLVGTLEDIIAQTEQSRFQPPAVIIVGEVVRLRQQLRWFDNQPLFGKRILVTRARHQASQLSRLLTEGGAVAIEMPVIQIQDGSEELDPAILSLDSYHWLIFTSVNGVKAFFHRLHALNLDARWLKGVKIGVIGPATAEALAEVGLRPDYLPQVYTSQGFLAGLETEEIAGCRVLLPRADIASKELVRGMAQLGAEVVEVTAYRTIPNTKAISRGKQLILAGEIDIITFTSSSTVTNLVAILGRKQQVLNRAKIACIGPTTAATAAQAGLKVDVIAEEHTIPGLVQAMERYFQGGNQ